MKRRRIVAALATAGAAATIGLAGANSASAAGMEGACYSTGSSHCYTVQRSNTFSPAATRVQTHFNYTCLRKPSAFSGWSSVQTMWTIPVDAPGFSDPGFVENGIWNQQGAPGADVVTHYWVRHGGTYGAGYQIFDTNVVAAANTSHWVQTQYNTTTWSIIVNNVVRGTLSSPQGPAQRVEDGGEATTNSGSHKFDSWGHQRVQSAVTYASWPGAAANSGWTSPPWTDPPTINTDSELYTRKTAIGAAC